MQITASTGLHGGRFKSAFVISSNLAMIVGESDILLINYENIEETCRKLDITEVIP